MLPNSKKRERENNSDEEEAKPKKQKPTFNEDEQYSSQLKRQYSVKDISFLLIQLYSKEEEVNREAINGLLFILRDESNIPAMIEGDVCKSLIELVMTNPTALKVICKILAGSNESQIQIFINFNLLTCLVALLDYKDSNIVDCACNAIANINTGNTNQIQAVINTNIFPALINILTIGENNSKIEALWAITNAILGATNKQIRFLAQIGCVQSLSKFLSKTQNEEAILVTLFALDRILNIGNFDNLALNPYSIIIERCEALEKLEYLQNSSNNKICEQAIAILNKHFDLVTENYTDTLVIKDEENYNSMAKMCDNPNCKNELEKKDSIIKELQMKLNSALKRIEELEKFLAL